MRIAVFSDVHGNSDAFIAIKRAMMKEAPDQYVFCGDLCGYYYDQNIVVEELTTLSPLASILGNHDRTFLQLLSNDGGLAELERKYGSSYRRLMKSCSGQALDFLRSLPESAKSSDETWVAYHGSPWNPLNEYIYPQDNIERFKKLHHRFAFLGHTHYPMDRSIGGIRVVNPGSCGQPRDWWHPSFAVVDTESGRVDIKRVAYDRSALRERVAAFDPGMPYLLKVLEREKEFQS